MNKIEFSPQYYPESDRSRALSNAYIYVGVPDTDPEVVVNQKQLYVLKEDGTSVAVSQPIRTSAGGSPIYQGSIVTIYVDGDYSLKVTDSNGAQEYYIPHTISSVPYIDKLSNYADLATAVTEIGATDTELWLDQDDSSNTTVPSNISVRPMLGNVMSGTVTWNCSIISDPTFQWLSGSGHSFGLGILKWGYAEWWGIDGTSDQVEINYCLTSIGKCKLLLQSYSVDDSINIRSGNVLEGNSMDDTEIVFDYATTGTPIINVSALSAAVRNLKLRYNSTFSAAIPTSDTGAYGIMMTDDGGSGVAWCSFENLYIHTCFGGIGTEVGSTKLWFNNVFTNIQIRNFEGWGLYTTDENSGNLFNSLYINNNWDRGGGTIAQDSLGLIYYGTGAQAVFNQLNLEHAVVSERYPCRFGADGRVTINNLHYEDISYTHATPSAILVSGTRSVVDITNIDFNSVVADANQTQFSLIRFDGSAARYTINGFTVMQDCNFDAVAGSVYWTYLSSSLDYDTAMIEIYGAYDETVVPRPPGDIDRFAIWDAVADVPVIRRFNDLKGIQDIVYKRKESPGSGNQTLTADMLLRGIIDEDPEGNADWTLDTSANIVSAIPDVYIGHTFETTIFNDATPSSGEVVTIVAGAGMTLHGIETLTEGVNPVAKLVFRITDSASGSENVDCYILTGV